MPNITIREEDLTTAAVDTGSSFAVFVPVFSGNELTKGYVGYISNQKEDGKTPEERFADLVGIYDEEKESSAHYGNHIAYELLRLGYEVYYKVITAITDLNTEDFWKELKDKANYPVRYLCTGLVGDSVASKHAIGVAEYRGDCIALVDIAGGDVASISTALGSYTYSKYAALFAPMATMSGLSSEYELEYLPASFYYLACSKHAIDSLGFKEWFAAAGLARGTSSTIKVTTPNTVYGDIDVNTLAPRTGTACAVNLIAKQGNGYYLWGNRTALQLTSDGLVASHFLNVRQLCTTLKKRIYTVCKQLSFDPNSDILWANFCSGVETVLKDMLANQGISNYKIVKIKSTQKAELKARIRIVPIEAVEDFDITVSLEDSLETINIAG